MLHDHKFCHTHTPPGSGSPSARRGQAAAPAQPVPTPGCSAPAHQRQPSGAAPRPPAAHTTHAAAGSAAAPARTHWTPAQAHSSCSSNGSRGAQITSHGGAKKLGQVRHTSSSCGQPNLHAVLAYWCASMHTARSRQAHYSQRQEESAMLVDFWCTALASRYCPDITACKSNKSNMTVGSCKVPLTCPCAGP
jgi:hypothetical protein